MGKIRGADLLVKALVTAGVKNIFTLSGNQIMPVFDACIDVDIDLIHVRHEASAVHMADAWGRLTGTPGVALVTAGPGHANALSALYSALAAESPLVLLSGHAPLRQLGRGAFQEMAQAEMASAVCKAAWTVNNATQLGHELAHAFQIASSGRPGPVHLSLPFDSLEESIDDTSAYLPKPADFSLPQTLLSASSLTQIHDHLMAAQRPLLLATPSLLHNHGHQLLIQAADVCGIPVIAMESPRGINDPSLGRFSQVLAQADLVVLLVKSLDFSLRFGDSSTFAEDCRFIQIDPDTRAVERNRAALALSDRLIMTATADAQPALQQLLESFSDEPHPASEWFDEVDSAIHYRPAHWRNFVNPAANDNNENALHPANALHPVTLCAPVQDLLDSAEQPILIADGGEFGQWAQACLSAPQRLINGPAGAIGSALPFALAARVAYPEATIVTLMGDGTFGFHMAEFDTAVRYQLPFIAVIGNDACWNAEYQIQRRNYGEQRLHSCELLATRYDQVVTALGAHGEYVEQPDQLKPALQRALDSRQPSAVNVSLQRHPAPLLNA